MSGHVTVPPDADFCPHVARVAELEAQLSRVTEERDEAGREREAWMQTAAQESRNRDYYQGQVRLAGALFGAPAFTSDDGSVQEDVLADKVPELVSGALAALAAMTKRAEEAQAGREAWKEACRKAERERDIDLPADLAAARAELEEVRSTAHRAIHHVETQRDDARERIAVLERDLKGVCDDRNAFESQRDAARAELERKDDALEEAIAAMKGADHEHLWDAIEACRAALAAPASEPVVQDLEDQEAGK